MRTLRVTLVLCAVCGLCRQASADSLRNGVVTARPFFDVLRPAQVFGEQPDALFGEHGKAIANCKLNIANCKLTEEPDNGIGEGSASNLQFAIPCDRLADSNWLTLTNDTPPSVTPGTAGVDARGDLRGFLPGVWRDAKGIVRTENMLVLGAALAAAIGIRQDLDDEVRQETAAHPDRWGDLTHTLGKLGEAPIQVPLLALLWGTSIWTGDPELNGFTHTLISAYTINGLSVLAVKAITDTDRPDPDWNGGRWGFPSFHAASSFTIAAVVGEYYGWRAAVPAYTLAGLISWSRIDERDHDLSDVVFGAAMGWVIGKSVAGQHRRGDGRVILLPWSHPYERAQGVALEVRY